MLHLCNEKIHSFYIYLLISSNSLLKNIIYPSLD